MEAKFWNKKRLYFVMPFVNGSELEMWQTDRANQYGSRFPYDAVKFFTAQILLGCEHLHKNKFIHRDLKPANILVDESGYVCIIDYGVASNLSEKDKTVTKVGTYLYMSPE